MNNCKRGAPLKSTPTNKKIKGEGKGQKKAAAVSTSATKKLPETNIPPPTMPPPKAAGRNYTN